MCSDETSTPAIKPTPQTQAEQKARDLFERLSKEYMQCSGFEALKDLTLLIQKANALDWLEKLLQERDCSTIRFARNEKPNPVWVIWNCKTQEIVGETLLSAIQQAQKEQ